MNVMVTDARGNQIWKTQEVLMHLTTGYGNILRFGLAVIEYFGSAHAPFLFTTFTGLRHIGCDVLRTVSPPIKTKWKRTRRVRLGGLFWTFKTHDRSGESGKRRRRQQDRTLHGFGGIFVVYARQHECRLPDHFNVVHSMRIEDKKKRAPFAPGFSVEFTAYWCGWELSESKWKMTTLTWNLFGKFSLMRKTNIRFKVWQYKRWIV